MRESIEWRLGDAVTPRSFHKAITDRELFVLAIAADLRACRCVDDPDGVLAETRTATLEIMAQRVVWRHDGGWLFQPGVWTDHPDFAHASALAEPPDGPSPMPGVAEDSSHSHRWPLWLVSFEAGSVTTDEAQLYSRLRGGLTEQFVGRVLREPSEGFKAPRTTNFMDGHNGVYRWAYRTIGREDGYGPYETSGTFALGWWSFLGSPEIQRSYAHLSRTFPLDGRELETYLGPGTTREQHPIVANAASYANGYRHLLVVQATTIDASDVARLTRPVI